MEMSVMSGKLKGIPALNTNTLSNPFCQKMQKTDTICGVCYSENMLSTFRRNCVPKFERNSERLSTEIVPEAYIPMVNAGYIRISAHGELINLTHMRNIVRFAIKNSHANVALWTKRIDIVHQFVAEFGELPENLILIYSNPKIDAVRVKPPKHFHKVFNNVSGKVQGEFEENCTGQKCIECLLCYSKDSGTDIIVEKVK